MGLMVRPRPESRANLGVKLCNADVVPRYADVFGSEPALVLTDARWWRRGVGPWRLGLTTCRVPFRSTRSLLMRLSEHRPSHEAKCASVARRVMSTSPSLTKVWATPILMPSIREVNAADPVQLTARSNWGAWLPVFRRRLGRAGCGSCDVV
jgi:hypothetical protein